MKYVIPIILGCIIVMLLATRPGGPTKDNGSPADSGLLELEGYNVLSQKREAEILASSFPTKSSGEKGFAGQYDSRYLKEKPLPQLQKGGEFIMMVEDSCHGRREYSFYPNGTVTVYREMPPTDTEPDMKKVYDVVKLDPKAIKKMQTDLKALGFFDLSINLINFKRDLLSNKTTVKNGKLKSLSRTSVLEEDGVTISLKVTHPFNRIYHAVHVYELEALQKEFPMIREYETFAKCRKLISKHIPKDKASDR